MKFPAVKFERFCSRLIIDSRDYGLIPLKLNGVQRYFLQEVARGMENGIHHFVCLKGRQLGMSTVGLALDLFWQFLHPGMQGALVVDKEKTRDQFRATLEAYLRHLPPAFKVRVLAHNRSQLVLGNRSRLSYLIAGGRQSGSLARGAGLSFLHATEMSSWDDPEGIHSLLSSLAERHPHRLFMFESTARGFNLFFDMWKDARQARSIHPIFIGWWRKEDYRLEAGSTLYSIYWNGKLNGEEKRWAREVKKLYDFDLKPEQWAWWRWKYNEHFHQNSGALAEFPFYEDQAFVLTGAQFFDLSLLTTIYKESITHPYTAYRYTVGARFEETRIEETRDGELTVWEEPAPDGAYVIAADPAYGESDNSDSFCIQVCRAWSDRLEQVAEYNTPNMTMYGFAWIIAHLCGAYSSKDREPVLILELGGPGRGVLQELLRMPAQYSAAIAGLTESQRRNLQNLFGSIQHYLYKKPDTFSAARLLQWETNFKTKTIMMNQLRDMLSRGMLKVHSPGFVEEARYVSQEGSRIAGMGRRKDDRVIAMALACMGWSDQLQPQLLGAGVGGARSPADPVNRVVGKYLQAMLEKAENAKQESYWTN
ncbi:MAG: hypothetical protein ACYDCJ_13000 [Gammaproteobacteria bacterium]